MTSPESINPGIVVDPKITQVRVVVKGIGAGPVFPSFSLKEIQLVTDSVTVPPEDGSAYNFVITLTKGADTFSLPWDIMGFPLPNATYSPSISTDSLAKQTIIYRRVFEDNNLPAFNPPDVFKNPVFKLKIDVNNTGSVWIGGAVKNRNSAERACAYIVAVNSV